MTLADPRATAPSRFVPLWKGYLRSLEVILAVLLIGVVVITLANVWSRSFGSGAIVWVDESARRILIWMTFIGSALAVAKATHLRIDSLFGNAPRWLARALPPIVGGVAIAFFLLLIFGGGRFAISSMARITPGMQVSAAWTMASVPVGGFLFLLSFLGRLRFGEPDVASETSSQPDLQVIA
jgi:TRAP-type transport system small permease protein